MKKLSFFLKTFNLLYLRNFFNFENRALSKNKHRYLSKLSQTEYRNKSK